jgi:hypothetical protein
MARQKGMSFGMRWLDGCGIERRMAGRLTSLLLVNRQCLPVLLLDLGELPVIDGVMILNTIRRLRRAVIVGSICLASFVGLRVLREG